MRPRLYKNYATTTFKLENHTLDDFKLMLNGKSKNSYVVEKIIELRKFFETATDAEKVNLVVELLPYASRRKHTGALVDVEKRKDVVVSVKCEKADYDVVVEEASKIGLTFSEIIRRTIVRDIENK